MNKQELVASIAEKAGMTKADIFSSLTVGDLAAIIRMKQAEKGK